MLFFLTLIIITIKSFKKNFLQQTLIFYKKKNSCEFLLNFEFILNMLQVTRQSKYAFKFKLYLCLLL